MASNFPKPISETDFMMLTARVDGIDKSLVIHQQQSVEVITKLAVFEAALKRSDDDVRRTGERHEHSISALKTSMENNYNSIFEKLESITDALGLDGTPATDKRLRQTLEKLSDKNNRHDRMWFGFPAAMLVWTAKALVIFIGGAVFMRLGLNIDIPGVK